jgi:CRISPR/Cas system-associated endoribonuclease Cas2
MERAAERIQVAVENGRLTQEEADARLAQLRERVTERINEPGLPERPDRGDRGPRENGPLSIVADTLGMTTDELLAALDDETSIADVAAAQGVDVEDVVDALMERATERIQVAVENGRLTQEEADARLAQLRERVTERINEPGLPERPDRGERGPRGERPER